jgi:predicted acetyltransferase
MSIVLLKPGPEHLGAYVAAIDRGWSADNLRDEARFEERATIERDPEAFLRTMDDRDAQAGPIRLPDGTLAARLPGIRRWIWDGDFAGSIGLRWQPGTPELPPQCLGHIGYSVVPWKRNRGYATLALALILPAARDEGLPYVEITTNPENVASQRVIVANSGVLVERFTSGQAYGNGEKLRFRITL